MAKPSSLTTSDTDNLIQRVHDLPPELYKEIHDLTFFTSFEAVYKIDKDYKPPNLLQVNQKWRKAFWRSFYGSRVFSVTGDEDGAQNLKRRLTSLTEEQRLEVVIRSTIEIHSGLKLRNASGNRRTIRERLESKDRDALSLLESHIQTALSFQSTILFRINIEHALRLRFETDREGEFEQVDLWSKYEDDY